ncbi:MAG: serine--tRNA ligase [Armatimonadetes bacterium]|nr:serine--tRNA ligase [Armatimonadota bacterium]
MIELKRLREEPELYREALRKKRRDPALAESALMADREWRDALQKMETLRADQNRASAAVPNLRAEERPARLAELRALSAELKTLEPVVRERKKALDRVLMRIPNPPHASVPEGADGNDNVTLRQWGERPAFPFPPRDHVEISLALDVVDFERAARVAGTRSYYLKNEAVLLQHGLVRFAMEFLVQQNFVPVLTPTMVRRAVVVGTMGGPGLDEQMVYRIEDEDLALTGTSEVPLVAMHMDEVLDAASLPLRYVGYSPCYRREAGAHGRDSKGLFRVHQFDKVEMVSFTRPDESWPEHDRLLALEERIMQALALPYRVVDICGGDLGDPAAKKYDIEAWMPGRGDYGETHSCSNCTDYQARRLAIRFRDGGNVETLHTLNGTAIATTRAILAILENGQQADGSVRIPDALVPYVGFAAIEPRRRSAASPTAKEVS